MRQALNVISKNLVNLVYPLHCQVCKTPLDPMNNYHVCPACISRIRVNQRPYCVRCGRSVERPDAVCAECGRRKPCFHMARSPFLYEGVIKECIHLMKYGKKVCLAKLLSRLMARFLKENAELREAADLIVPVPLFARKLRERGFNQSKVLARGICAELHIPASDALVKSRPTRPQSDLSKEGRMGNIKGAFRVRGRNSVRGKVILIVDDVLTTGATLNECASVLAASGAARINVITLARGS
ncbi:ComF family protein [Candidatus Omnitrophota bacterium]